MIAILSPAMNMAPTSLPLLPPARPRFWRDAAALADRLRRLDPWQLEGELGLSPELALSVWRSYQEFDAERPGTPAALSFKGLAYQHLAAGDFSREDFAFAGGHLRMLSALYGLLRPDDGILPYRLDFVCRWGKREKLYAYWGSRVCDALFAETKTVVNLCSGEYEKLIVPHLKPGKRLVTCRFLTRKAGRLRCLATASKMARGEMARRIVKSRITDPENLRSFDWDGFSYMAELSGEDRYTFAQQ